MTALWIWFRFDLHCVITIHTALKCISELYEAQCCQEPNSGGLKKKGKAHNNEHPMDRKGSLDDDQRAIHGNADVNTGKLEIPSGKA